MTMRNEEYLDGILAALGAGEDAGVPAPVWRHEAYLAAIYGLLRAGVPLSKQLAATVGVTDCVPYTFRTAGGSADIGETAVDQLVGGTVVWNQLADEDDVSVTVPGGHKYAACIDGVWSVGTSDGTALTVDGAAGDMVFDLTQMLGAAIAGYVATLETAASGAGTAWFRKLFPKAHYAYNAGTMLSVQVSAHTMVGFNAYDPAAGAARVVGGMQYQITGGYTALALDGDAVFPDGDGKFTPAASGTLTVTGGSAATCVHLVWDGERDWTFEHYIRRTYALDGSLTLRGVPKLDAANKLYYDGDAYLASGAVVRKYGVADLGSLTWNASASPTADGSTAYVASISDMATDSSNQDMVSDVCVPGPTKWVSGMTVNTMIRNAGRVIVAASAAPTAGHLIYPLATPAYEAGEPFENPQWVDDFGTEAYEAAEQGDVAVPVGHETLYKTNLRAKLEMAPDSPADDGDYLLRHTGGKNVYVPRSELIPDLPSSNGTYRLQVTVSGSTKTLSWAAV